MFFERPESGEVAILVHISIESDKEREDPIEFEELALSAGAQPVEFITGTRKQPSPNHFVGSGKLEEIAAAVDVPVIAIGGLGFSDALRIEKTAAAGLAGIRLFMSGEKLTDDQRFRQIAQCRGAFGSN